MREYLPLGSFSPALAGACTLTRPAPPRVTLDSPALDVMTDFAQVTAATIERSASLATANDYMVTRGVRSLFVVAPDGRLAGLITTTDLLGEAPVRASHARGIKRHELTVGDVMTPAEGIVALKLEDVRSAKVGHIVASLKQAGRHHELVAETLPGGEVRIRGMFSVSQIARQLGMPLQISELARTFAEIEKALAESGS
ncbi:MAG: CBS domain-containing protein [Burkholderiales bacterium]